MKKFIFLMDALQLLALLMTGKRVQGVLYIDENTGKLTFKPYYGRGQHRKSDRKIANLENGWVKESEERIKVYLSEKKNIGTVRVCEALKREMGDACNAIVLDKIIGG